MRYRKLPPCPSLRGVVDSLWIQEVDAPSGEPAWVLPTGTVELLIHYGERLSHVETGRPERMPRTYLTGQRTRPVLPTASGSVGIVLVSLPPWGAEVLFPGAHEAVDGFVDLAGFVPESAVRRLEQAVGDAPTDAARLSCVEDFLEERRRGALDPRFVHAARRFGADPNLAVAGLADEVGLSRRHFHRSFRRAIGLNPKTFARVMRFQRALRAWRCEESSWAAAAQAAGYADQAHLVRDVREFSGRTPTELSFEPGDLGRAFNGAQASEYFEAVYL